MYRDLSEQAVTYEALSKYMDLLLDAICVVDKEGRFIYVSAGCERIFGYSPDEMIGRPMIELVHPDDRHITLQTVDQIVAGQPQPHFENRYLRKDGQVAHIMWSARWSEADQCRIAVARDISARRRAEAMQHATYAISEASHTTEDLDTLYARIHRIIGDLLPANNFSIILHDSITNQLSFPYQVDERGTTSGPLKLDSNTACAQVIRSGQPLLTDAGTGDALSWLGVPLKLHQDIKPHPTRKPPSGKFNKGTMGAIIVKSYDEKTRYTEADKELLQYVSTQIATAIERKHMMSHLQHIALYDQLTQLPNRALFYDRIHSALARARRHEGMFSLLYMDLDRFKEVNDSFGHGVGDQLLEAVARRLEQCLRECDTVARFGGDEFVVLLESISDAEQSTAVATKIAQVLSREFQLGEHCVKVIPSIGIAHFPLHGDSDKLLLHHADQAMYQAKKSGRYYTQD